MSNSGCLLTINEKYDLVQKSDNRINLENYKALKSNKEKVYMILDFFVKNNEVK